MRILISGASGVIGTALTSRLRSEGHEVIRLVRRPASGPDERQWTPSIGHLEPAVFDGVDAVVNLSGAGIGDKRWTKSRRREIVSSRLDTTRLLAEVMAGLDTPPGLFMSQSAIGYYGDRDDEILTESSRAGSRDSFLTDLAIDWEAAAAPARAAGIRVIHPRTGVVLVPETQLLGRLVPLFKFGLGGKIGSGDQWWSWISLPDEISALMLLLESDLEGPVNLVAPNPVTNREFTDTLGDLLNRPTLLMVPRFAIRTAMGTEMADELSLSSTRVIPERLVEAGFEFEHGTLETALAWALNLTPSDAPS